MTAKYNKLLRKSKINEVEYMNWNSDLVCYWIISLDKEYERYESTLRIKAKEQDVDGQSLAYLDKSDLLNIGISSIKHRMAIVKHIKRITSTQINEGNNAAPTAYI